MNYKQIKSFEDACKALNLEPNVLPDVSRLPETHRKALISHWQLIIITEAINAGWIPNWYDTDQYKYYPWFEVEASEDKPSGFGFSGADYDDSCSAAGLGSRLCFENREKALYAGEMFKQLYIDYFLLT